MYALCYTQKTGQWLHTSQTQSLVKAGAVRSCCVLKTRKPFFLSGLLTTSHRRHLANLPSRLNRHMAWNYSWFLSPRQQAPVQMHNVPERLVSPSILNVFSAKRLIGWYTWRPLFPASKPERRWNVRSQQINVQSLNSRLWLTTGLRCLLQTLDWQGVLSKPFLNFSVFPLYRVHKNFKHLTNRADNMCRSCITVL